MSDAGTGSTEERVARVDEVIGVGSSRKRTRGWDTSAQDADLPKQRELVDAFLAASREGSFEGLVAVLHPDVVFRIDAGGRGPNARAPISGAEAVARQVLARGTPFARFARPAVVNGRAGALVASGDTTLAVAGFTIARGHIVAIDVIIDRDKLRRLSPRP